MRRLAVFAPLVLVACGPSTHHGTVNGLTYDVSGSGPVVVLIADSAGRTVWDKQFPVFARTFEVIRYEPVATADALNALLDHLAVKKASLIALGAGAPPAIDLTLAHPDRVEALVLVSPHMTNEHGTLTDLKVPLLLVVGTRGDSAAVLGVDSLRVHMGGVQTVTMPGAGHQVNVDRFKSFNTVVQEFLFHIHPEVVPHRSS